MLYVRHLKPRPFYLDKLLTLQQSVPIIILTGIRRCGKSSLLKLLSSHLRAAGVADNQILSINFEAVQYKSMTADGFYDYVKEHICTDKKSYLILDEIQHVQAWELTVNALTNDFDCAIYITSSRRSITSSEYTAYLAGHYVKVPVLPLSFVEFCSFYDFTVYDGCLNDAFDAYIHYGGLPSLADTAFDDSRVTAVLDGIYASILFRDILEPGKQHGRRQLTDSSLLNHIAVYLAGYVGQPVSVTTMGSSLAEDKSLHIPSPHTLQAYVEALVDSHVLYDVRRYDIKAKKFLRTLGKYYFADTDLLNYLIGYDEANRGPLLENVVYLELLRRGYEVSIGKIGREEIDFVATKSEEKIYIQVVETMETEEARQKVLKPLMDIRDNYEKIVLSLHPGPRKTYGGIKSINLIEWFC